LAVGNLLVGIGLGLSGAAGTMSLLALTVLVWTVGEMMSSAVANAYLASVSPPRLVGRYQGMYFVAYTVGAGAGPLLGGALFASNPTLLWILVGLGGVASGWLALPTRQRSPPDDDPRSKGITAAP
jgi:MFS family permease